MSLITLEVELDHGRVVSRGSEPLPDKAVALLTILSEGSVSHPQLTPDPELRVVLFEDPAKPLDPEDWPEAFE